MLAPQLLLIVCTGITGFFQGYDPPIAKASEEGERAISRFKVPEGFKLNLFASEPMLANPIAFTVDNKNRVHLVEVFRLHTGAIDIRKYMKWLDDELALKNVGERDVLLKKIFGDKYPDLSKDHDRIRLLIDNNGDGKADEAKVFADGFKNAVDGLAAGILVRGNKTYLTCIPDLWLLEDTKNQGKADKKTSLHHGFGVHIAFIGHDLHGLILGPDGKIYFSVGDRGTALEKPSPNIQLPHMGAVFRCNPDGSDLEVFHKGLRNPQELAFDAYGNLFTVDNNSDAGDQARVTYLVPGGDSGWRCGYQYIEKPNPRGPWNSELLWKPRFDGQSAYIIPPLMNLSSGPSGLTFYPGTGFDSTFDNHFFLCDFRGAPANSGVWSFRFLADGAGFKVDNPKQFLWSILGTDVDFGPDGAMYISDWVDGWNQTGKGRLYRMTHEKGQKDPIVKEVKNLLAQDWEQVPTKELIRLLEHKDGRVRKEAHLALAAKGPSVAAELMEIAKKSENELAKIHAIWAMGIIARKNPSLGKEFISLLQGNNDEIKAQVARQLGELKCADARGDLVLLLKKKNPRLQFFASLALANMPDISNFQPLVDCLDENADKDAFLRHGIVMALAAITDPKRIADLKSHSSSPVRLGAVLALRNQKSHLIKEFLEDSDPKIHDEAARAIADLPMEDLYPSLEKFVESPNGKSSAFLRRAMAASRTNPSKHNAESLAKLASNNGISIEIRKEALAHLDSWASELKRDIITGQSRTTKSGSKEDASSALKLHTAKLLADSNISKDTIKVASNLGIKEITPVLLSNISNHSLTAEQRKDSLKALEMLGYEKLLDISKKSLGDPSEIVRAQAIKILGRNDKSFVMEKFDSNFENCSAMEQQSWVQVLGTTNTDFSRQKIARLMEQIKSGTAKHHLILDIMQASQNLGLKKEFPWTSIDPEKPETYAFALEGGDSLAGRNVFFEKASVSCLRCHKIQGQGGDVGPDLTGIALKQNRAYLLDAIVHPNKHIAKGYDSFLVTLNNGKTISGILKVETPSDLTLMTAEGKIIKVSKNEIDEKTTGKSAMPADIYKQLSPHELRDLVEYLANLK